jgi:predicted DNA-binding helix-hairpin-helix protein
LLKIPGIGPITATRIIDKRRYGKIQDIQTLRSFGVSTQRAAKFILLDGRQTEYQPLLF